MTLKTATKQAPTAGLVQDIAHSEEDALAALALAAGADPETGEITPGGAAGTVLGNGVESASAFSLKSFLPRDPDWIGMNVTNKPIGTEMLIGRIAGEVSGIERKVNTWEGKEIKSIGLHGLFMAENAEGKQWSFPLVFLPNSYSEQVAHAFEHQGAQRVTLEIDCGIRVIKKAIRYEWTIKYYAEGRAIQALRSRMASRKLGEAPRQAMRGHGDGAGLLSAPEPTGKITDVAAD